MKATLPGHVSIALLLGGCAAIRPPAPSTSAGDDLPPASHTVDGLTVVRVGAERPAVGRLVESWRAALGQRDVARLRALVVPGVGGVQQAGPGMSREAWLTLAEAIFTSAARVRPWLEMEPTVVAYGECAPRCPSALLAPGEWLVRWPGLVARRVQPGLPSDRVLPSTLRVTVADGVAVVAGVDDDIATALGPTTVRLSGFVRP